MSYRSTVVHNRVPEVYNFKCVFSQEDDIVTRVGNSKESYNARISEGEVQRNRHRVAEINHFLENIRDELEQYEHLDR